ncbi:hypothetical protein F7725_009565 [Dissostichus mawsoni]|uniref:Uncharacterized protein n=1 Tax=Dissostichus mawsoni TaxID=36200 RepID=A0A7J5XMH0_DISMA|nr:hypothetical protein F7725_009565 [Dissostichus mawsoni]
MILHSDLGQPRGLGGPKPNSVSVGRQQADHLPVSRVSRASVSQSSTTRRASPLSWFTSLAASSRSPCSKQKLAYDRILNGSRSSLLSWAGGLPVYPRTAVQPGCRTGTTRRASERSALKRARRDASLYTPRCSDSSGSAEASARAKSFSWQLSRTAWRRPPEAAWARSASAVFSVKFRASTESHRWCALRASSSASTWPAGRTQGSINTKQVLLQHRKSPKEPHTQTPAVLTAFSRAFWSSSLCCSSEASMWICSLTLCSASSRFSWSMRRPPPCCGDSPLLLEPGAHSSHLQPLELSITAFRLCRASLRGRQGGEEFQKTGAKYEGEEGDAQQPFPGCISVHMTRLQAASPTCEDFLFLLVLLGQSSGHLLHGALLQSL